MSSPSWYCGVAVATLLAGWPLTSTTGSVAASGDDDSAVVVETAGDAAGAIELPPAAIAGQTATSVTHIDVVIAAGGPELEVGVELHASTEVVGVADDESYQTRSRYGDVVLTSGDATANAAAFDVLAGVEFRRTIEASGRVAFVAPVDPHALSDEQRRAFASVAGNLQGAQTVYPDVPVGVGARWTVEQPVSGDSFPVTAVYRYELTAIEDGRFTIAVSYSSTFDTSVDGVAAAGTITGLGSINGSVEHPLDVTYTLGQSTLATAGGTTVDVAVTVRTESTPA